MRLLPRFRFTIRRMMIAVLIIALACGLAARWNARRLRRQALHAEATAQSEVTHAIMSPIQARYGVPGRQSSGGGSFGSWPGGVRWTRVVRTWDGFPGKSAAIDVEASGGLDGDDLEPISIKDNGGPRSAEVIDELTRAYRKRGWRYTITPLASPGSPRQGADGRIDGAAEGGGH